MDREEAEKIVHRDLPGVIKQMLKGLPVKPPDGIAKQIYDSSFEGLVTNLMDGTIPLTPADRLTIQLVESTGALTFKLTDSSHNITNP